MAAELWALTRAARADTLAFAVRASDKMRERVKEDVESCIRRIRDTLHNQAKYNTDTESEGRRILEWREQQRKKDSASASASASATNLRDVARYTPYGYTIIQFPLPFEGDEEQVYIQLFVAELKARQQLDGVRIEPLGAFDKSYFKLYFDWRPPSLVETERPGMLF